MAPVNAENAAVDYMWKVSAKLVSAPIAAPNNCRIGSSENCGTDNSVGLPLVAAITAPLRRGFSLVVANEARADRCYNRDVRLRDVSDPELPERRIPGACSWNSLVYLQAIE